MSSVRRLPSLRGVALVAAVLMPGADALAHPSADDPPLHPEMHGDAQGAARREVSEGAILRIRAIERRVLPMMPGAQYLGPEYDEHAMVYRLKFIRDGRVSFVDVDARSGAIIGRSP